MRLFATRLGETRLMLPAAQIRRVLGADELGSVQRVELSDALGLGAPPSEVDAAEPRVLLCGHPSDGVVGFRLQQALVETELGKAALVSLPQVMRRLGPPCWLAGFARVEEGLALVVDLDRLTRRMLLSAPAVAEAG